MELRHGRWQDVLADVPACDLLLCDPPYSARTHEGRRSGSNLRQKSIPYDPLKLSDARELVAWATPRVREFAVVFCAWSQHRLWERLFTRAGWYVFAPSVWAKTDAAPRFSGDGPRTSCECIMVARKRVRIRRPESRDDVHSGPTASTRGLGDEGFPGMKPVWLMQALVAAYSEPGDLVVDAYAGSGTTLIAASQMGRRSIGAEMDAGRYALASRRIRKGYTPDFFSAA
jgi:site-specific DNA-methyltransferase (adenine-specific)